MQYNRLSESTLQGTFSRVYQYTQSQLGLGASWELDFWGRFRRAVEAADQSLLASAAGSERSALLVPESALGFDQQGSYVLVVNGENQVERRPARTGEKVGAYRVVEEGVAAEEWVIVAGLPRAMPGARVTPLRKAAETAGAGRGSDE